MTEEPATDRAGASGRSRGSIKGRMVVRHDFDAPLPPNVLDALATKHQTPNSFFIWTWVGAYSIR